jgi:SM-20-related protein
LACHASSLPPKRPPELPEQIAATLADQGWCVTDDFLPPLLVCQLRQEAQQLWQAGGFRHAGVGRGAELRVRDAVRTDRVAWLDPSALSAAQRLYWTQLEQLRLAVNQMLFLGLYELEAHLAVYPPGTYYRKHLDQFRGIGARTLSCVLYLNDDWLEQDGGALRIYTEPEAPERSVAVLPKGGRLVSFFSARFLHEVEPAQRERFSLTGWFKRRSAQHQ